MEIDFEEVRRGSLFHGITAQEIEGLLCCLGAMRADYKNGDFIVLEGSQIDWFGVMLSGHGRSIKWDSSDRVILISLLEKGSEIGVILAASGGQRSPVSVQALDGVSILKIPYRRVLTRRQMACPGHDKLLYNFIKCVACKGLVLHERIDCLLRPTVREKILAYLTRVSKGHEKRTFEIPMNRNAMAEYLNIERSALSRELSKMKRDGVIDYHKNVFKLMEREQPE